MYLVIYHKSETTDSYSFSDYYLSPNQQAY